jgi:hypothetical protein
MMSNNDQEGRLFTPPAHFFSDPIALSLFLEEHYPGDMEAVPVTADNIEIMETAAGFLMPEDYVDHWLTRKTLTRL